MQATELRLGNKVMWDGKIGIITSIEEKTVGVMLDNGYSLSASIGSVKGIVLTPELLEKYGFEVYNNFDNHSVDYYKKERIRLQMSNYEDHECYVVLYDEEQEQYSYEIKYLHQLQNLFYSLTGTELKIEL